MTKKVIGMGTEFNDITYADKFSYEFLKENGFFNWNLITEGTGEKFETDGVDGFSIHFFREIMRMKSINEGKFLSMVLEDATMRLLGEPENAIASRKSAMRNYERELNKTSSEQKLENK